MLFCLGLATMHVCCQTLTMIHDLWFSHTVRSDSLQHQLYGVYRIGFMQIRCLVRDSIHMCKMLFVVRFNKDPRVFPYLISRNARAERPTVL